MDDNALFRVTEHELVALLHMVEDAETRARVGEALGLTPLLGENLVQRAGLQTLLVRDLVTLDGTEANAQHQARAIATVAQNAQECLVATIDNEQLTNIISFIDGPAGRLMVSIQPTGVHEARLLDPSTPLSDLLFGMVRAYDSDAELSRPLLVRLRRVGEAERGVRLEVIEPGVWRYAVSSLLAKTGDPDMVWPHVAQALAS